MSSSSASNIVQLPIVTGNNIETTSTNSHSLESVDMNAESLFPEYLSWLHKNRKLFDGKEDEKMTDNKLLEKYMDKVDADQRYLKEEMREREERMIKTSADSEARITERLNQIQEMISNQNNVVNSKFEKMDEKLEDSVKDIKENKIAIWGICIATILSVAGIAYAAMQVFQGFVSLVK